MPSFKPIQPVDSDLWYQHFGRLIHEALEKSGLAQKTLSERFNTFFHHENLNPSTVSLALSGRRRLSVHQAWAVACIIDEPIYRMGSAAFEAATSAEERGESPESSQSPEIEPSSVVHGGEPGRAPVPHDRKEKPRRPIPVASRGGYDYGGEIIGRQIDRMRDRYDDSAILLLLDLIDAKGIGEAIDCLKG